MKNLLLSLLPVLFVTQAFAQSTTKLWYDKPAEHFEESLVLGNGKIGASVFGGTRRDKIYLNDATLWSGEPVNANMRPAAFKFVPAIREALRNENYKLADSLQRNLQGSFSESYAPLGTMFLKFNHASDPKNYYRELDMSNAISKTTYEIEGVKFIREYFISHPDKAFIIKLKSSKKAAINVEIGFESLLKYTFSKDGNTLAVNGYAPYHTEPAYRGNMPNAIQFDENRGTRFTSLFTAKTPDGNVVISENSLKIADATEAIIYVTIETSFNGFDKNPATEGKDNRKLAKQYLNAAVSKDFSQIKTAHITDYQRLFNRMTLDLGKSDAPNLPTNERLKRHTKGEEDKNLEILYVQFGRYLLISSSRTPEVPANLQGIWNPYLRPPWSSNYTVNINLEENYWPAEITNLSELHQPLLSFIGNLEKTGKITAKTFYGVNGWTVAHNSDIWAMTNPVGDFGKGDPNWANWNMGGAWLSTHLWEHYTFTQDKEFLRKTAYPLLKGSSRFCLEWLVEDKNGYLVTSPSTSPENSYISSDGYHGFTFYGGTADLSMIRECFLQTINAAEILEIDAEYRRELTAALEKLYPYQIGKKGNLQEWYYDWEDEDPQHRHQSHLFGLFPGHHISPDKTPELAAACRRTLEIKGDESTGWSKGWRINLWARLQDGNRAYKMYRELLKYVEPDGVKTANARGGGTYPNLFDAHPPFQIDGNFGGTAAVVEMLIQSTPDEINLLPALPDAWPEGKIAGVKARGGYELSFDWKDSTLRSITISAVNAGKTTLINGGKRKEISLKKGEKITVKW